jgi:cytochrome c oxidase cbb3-type subunit 2
MNRLSYLLFGAVGILLFTAVTLVVNPYFQLRRIEPESHLRAYTIAEWEGRAQYVSLGCVYCHSQQPRDPSFGPDALRGWGRPSTPGDYAHDYPHVLGTMRTGPDLFNIGARQSSAQWHLAHLYEPRALVPQSIMPAYPFLFEERLTAGPEDAVVQLPPASAPPGKVIVARPQALALVQYLLSLDHTYPSDYLPRDEGAVASGGSP